MDSALTTTMDMAVSRGRTEGIAAEEFDGIVRSHQRRVFGVLFSAPPGMPMAAPLPPR